MRRLLVTLMLFTILVPAAALAQPIPGIYRPATQGGTLQPIRGSFSWSVPDWGGSSRQSVFCIGSQAGATFGGQYLLQCGLQPDQSEVTVSFDESGNMSYRYRSLFTGGHFSLGADAWGSPSTGILTTMVVIDSLYYGVENFTRLMSLEGEGLFVNGAAFHLSVSRAPAFSSSKVLVEGYPGFLDDQCQPSRQDGACFDGAATITIEGVVPVRPASWGTIKARYR